MGTDRLRKSDAFKEFYKDEFKRKRKESLNAASSETLWSILCEHFPGCDIFGIKNMAERYGVSVENFRSIAKNEWYPAPIKFYEETDPEEICINCKKPDKDKPEGCIDVEKEWRPCEDYSKKLVAQKTHRPWAANQAELDRWFLEAEKRRRDNKERSDENLFMRMVKKGEG